MVVIAAEASLFLQSVDRISRSPCTASSSLLLPNGQQQMLQHRRFSSSSCSSSVSSSFPASPYFSSSSSPSCSSSASFFAESIAIQRRIPVGGTAGNPRAATISRVGHGGTGAVANPSRPAIAARPAAFVSGPIARPLHAAIAETAGEGLKWWEKGGAPNMADVHSTEEFLAALSNAGEKLVIVEFYATWCGSCRALFPKFCKIAMEYSDINFLKVNFDENKPMCKSLNVKVLPFFHIYRGTEGRLDSFSCSLSKLQRLKDAIVKHHDGPCEDCAPPESLGDLLTPLLQKASADQPATAAGSSE